MISSSNPTILLVTGASTTRHCYDLLAPLLPQAGFLTVAVALPSANPTDPYEHTAGSDGASLLEQHLLPLVEAGSDFVVFAHSFGATTLSGASHHLSKSERTAMEAPVSQPLWSDPQLEGRRIMIKTLQDAIFALTAQQAFADSSGVDWQLREVAGGHEVFLTKSKAVADIVIEVVRSWT